MIRLDFYEPAVNRFLHSVTQRMPASHPRYSALADEYGRRASGFRGERSLAYELRYFREDECVMLHGLALELRGMRFQIDTLLLHPKFTAVIEVKNWAGALRIGGAGEMVRDATVHAEARVFPDPVQQAKNQLRLLVDWLEERGVKVRSPETLVVLANSQVTLEPPERIPANVVCRPAMLERLLEWRRRACPAPATFTELKAAADLLAEANSPRLPASGFAHDYHISRADISPGVICPNCGALAMNRGRKYWRCRRCCHVCAEAHLSALTDWTRAFGSRITACEARDFLTLSATQQARRLLHRSGAEKIGADRQTHYDLLASEAIRLLL
ncbi:nuclease-related domain-containing protein [Salisediminibacterium halotolerans]|uniref:Nuclease-related domain-containing protein n=1 Tax=Salisediminibacterium halotolerans TaxID=517425 RepID=A0A1H9QJF6_9BACI|nr:nuclease-related domain-containing protein [Salisediminibacterium haloalkalitolerans]SER60701.1 Nuclease-related domain-containing protein [Salisediminibacterium haloalkalitolerans]